MSIGGFPRVGTAASSTYTGPDLFHAAKACAIDAFFEARRVNSGRTGRGKSGVHRKNSIPSPWKYHGLGLRWTLATGKVFYEVWSDFALSESLTLTLTVLQVMRFGECMDLRAVDHGQCPLHDVAIDYVELEVLSEIPYDIFTSLAWFWPALNANLPASRSLP